MLTLAEIADATGGTLTGDPALEVTAVCTDTRAITPGCLFIALKGANYDGHAYAAQAVRDGAAAVLVAGGWTGSVDAPTVVVSDTLKALGHVARYWRRKLGVKVVAITGSSGKTSTKETVAAYLGLGYHVLKTEANYNNEVGVPLTLLRLRPEHDIAVVEMGMRAEGEIAYLTEIAEPDIGIITNIGTAHIGRLGSQEAIARAKAELWNHMPPGGTAILNYDDPLAATEAGKWGGRIVTFSLTSPVAKVWSHDVHPEGEGQVFTVYWKPKKGIQHGRAEIHLPLWGDHHRANALAAIATGWALGDVPASKVWIQPEKLPGRVQTLTAGGVQIVDDTYNANPDSMKAALKAFVERPGEGYRYAVLGDMGELGDEAELAHEELGRFAAGLGLDGVVAVGKLASRYCTANPECVHFENGDQACDFLSQQLRAGDQVLFKASRAAKFETLVERLKTNLGA
jgi:UDP-N-acetylmuramoyl-tripeptide--D-alanyl-D-alanine ligase